MPIPQSPEDKSSGKKLDKSLIGSVITDLGGVLFAVEAIDKVLGFASKAFTNNKFYQSSIKVLRGMTPVIITGHKIYSSVKGYKEQQKQIYARQKRSTTILRLMKLEYLDDFELDCLDFALGREIIAWLMTRPKTENFKIIDFYNIDFEPILSKLFDKGELYILIQSDNNKYMLEVDITVLNQQIYVSSCNIHCTQRGEKIWQLRTRIFSEFIKSFNTSKNIIEMTGKGLQTRNRLSFDYNIYQFDIDSFKKEINKAIQKRKKRGYILIGPPGVGKSTVLIKLEKEFPEIPIVYVSPTANVFREDISNTFTFLRSISPCIAIFEDLDGYELAHKQDKIFGEFIEQMDSLKHKESIIAIATLNDPEAIHASLINRRGRFDKVFFMDYPKDAREILNVMKNKYKKETGQEFPFDIIKDEIYKKICDNSFSHADLCEIVENMTINDYPITWENIDKGIDEVIKTMKAVQKCSKEKPVYNEPDYPISIDE